MQTRRLGRIGHDTSVLVYGAAALGSVTQEVADASLAEALDAGINHLDTAASYGDAELLMGPTLERVRGQVFLGTKTGERSADAAWAELNRSLELMRTDHVDLWQVHGVCDMAELDKVFVPGGAIEAFVRAKDEGLATHLGITGHTEAAPSVHTEALRRFDFDSVLTPMNYHHYTADPAFAADFDELYTLTGERDVALRTIKAVARRPWDGAREYATWYRPFDDPELIRAAISWVLATFPRIAGIATAGEVTLLRHAIAAEKHLLTSEEAAAQLAQVEDWATIFV